MISKKQLLQDKNISYGQLYRWKREGLIPDEWFIKQSVPTGQETFFDENLIIPRIDKILDLKTKFGIDEIKAFFKKDRKTVTYSIKDAILLDDVDPYLLKMYLKDEKTISLNELSLIRLLSKYNNIINSVDYIDIIGEDYNNNDSLYILFNGSEYYLAIGNIHFIDPKIKIIIKNELSDIYSETATMIKNNK